MEFAQMRALRLTNGVRVVELARGLGVTPSMISQWEAGYRVIPAGRADQIEAAIKRIAEAKRQASIVIERVFAECRATNLK